MKRAIFTSVVVVIAWWGVGANFAAAQFGTFGQPPARVRPTVSPFINLRGGAMNYYGIIRPQTDATRSITQLQNAVSNINADAFAAGQTDPQGQPSALGGLQTGHTVTYFNYGHYYPPTPTGAGAGASLGSSAGYNPNAATNVIGIGYGLGLGGFGRNFVAPAVIIR